MKKYRILILLFILMIINFLYNWFEIGIESYNSFLGFLIGLICYFSFIYILIFLLKKLFRKEDLLVNSVTFCILIVYLIFKMSFPFVFAKSKFEMKFYEVDRIKVVQKIKNGEIPSHSKSTIYLSSEYDNLALKGIVSIYKNDSNGIVVGFNVYSGGIFSSDIEIIYSSTGIDDVKKINTIKEIRKIKENWYYVIIR